MCVHWYFAEHFSGLSYRFFSNAKRRILDEFDVLHVFSQITNSNESNDSSIITDYYSGNDFKVRQKSNRNLLWSQLLMKGNKNLQKIKMSFFQSCCNLYLLLFFSVSSRNSHWRCSIKNLFLKISQYSQENNCIEVSF